MSDPYDDVNEVANGSNHANAGMGSDSVGKNEANVFSVHDPALGTVENAANNAGCS